MPENLTCTATSSDSKRSQTPEAGVATDVSLLGTSRLTAIEQINYYAWDRSSKASKLAARGPNLARPKRDRRTRDYLAQLFGDSDAESLDAEPQGQSSAQAQSGSSRLANDKLGPNSSPPASQPPPPASNHSSGT